MPDFCSPGPMVPAEKLGFTFPWVQFQWFPRMRIDLGMLTSEPQKSNKSK